jgi:hypothetical protein
MRQATSITSISAPGDATGDLSFLTATGSTRTWSHNGGLKEAHFNNGMNNGLLAKNIEALTFVGYEADGVTETTTVGDIQAVKCTVQVMLAGSTRTISCRAWIRSW